MHITDKIDDCSVLTTAEHNEQNAITSD